MKNNEVFKHILHLATIDDTFCILVLPWELEDEHSEDRKSLNEQAYSDKYRNFVAPMDGQVVYIEEVEEEGDAPITFEQFWDKYGMKKGRTVCERMWPKLKKRELEAINLTLQDYLDETSIPPDNSKRYRKLPETYLRQKVWVDYLTAKKPKPVAKSSELLAKLRVASASEYFKIIPNIRDLTEQEKVNVLLTKLSELGDRTNVAGQKSDDMPPV